jgi:hypothetical protein
MICNEVEFKSSNYGKQKIAALINELSTVNRPVTSSYFDINFLKSFYIQSYSGAISPGTINCYELLLDYWSSQRRAALGNEQQLAKNNKVYEDWLKNGRSPLDRLGDLFNFFITNWQLTLIVTAAAAVLGVFKNDK